jgi:hypothetical protein
MVNELESRLAPRPGWRRQLLVLACVAVLTAPCIRSLLREDARFGWGMFGSNIAYTIHYEWILEDGSRQPYQPGDELRSTARRLTQRDREPWRPHNMFYGPGTLRSLIGAYQRYLFENRRPPMATAIEARLRTSVNPGLSSQPDASRVALTVLRHARAGAPR